MKRTITQRKPRGKHSSLAFLGRMFRPKVGMQHRDAQIIVNHLKAKHKEALRLGVTLSMQDRKEAFEELSKQLHKPLPTIKNWYNELVRAGKAGYTLPRYFKEGRPFAPGNKPLA